VGEEASERPPKGADRSRPAFEQMTLEIQGIGQAGFRRAQAVGIVGSPEGYLHAEVSLRPGAYWITVPMKPMKAYGFRVPDDRGPTIILCPHSRRTPSEFQMRPFSDAGGAQLFGDQIMTLQPCCRANYAEWRSGSANVYALGMYIPLQGSCRMTVAGREWTVREGEYLLMNPLQSGGLSDAQSRRVRIQRILMFQPVLRQFRETLGLSRILGPFNFSQGPRRLTEGMATALEVWRQGWEAVGTRANDELMRLACRLLFLHLFNEHPSGLRERWAAAQGGRGQDPRLRAAAGYIARHYATATVSDVSRELGVGVDWLRRHFKREFHQTLKTYVGSVRVQKAMELLRDRTNTVDDIARAVGYRSVPAFYRVFRARTRTNPLAARRLTSPSGSDAPV